MAYTPTEWTKGDTITAEKLNKMEQGIAAKNPLICTFTGDNDSITCDKTIAEIEQAYTSGASIYGVRNIGFMTVPVQFLNADPTTHTAVFSAISVSAGGVVQDLISYVSADETWLLTSTLYPDTD